MKICLIIPTLNEKNNVTNIINKIKKTKIILDILFIDDNSTDGTQNEILELKKNLKIFIIFSEKKRQELGQLIKKELNIVIKMIIT